MESRHRTRERHWPMVMIHVGSVGIAIHLIAHEMAAMTIGFALILKVQSSQRRNVALHCPSARSTSVPSKCDHCAK